MSVVDLDDITFYPAPIEIKGEPWNHYTMIGSITLPRGSKDGNITSNQAARITLDVITYLCTLSQENKDDPILYSAKRRELVIGCFVMPDEDMGETMSKLFGFGDQIPKWPDTHFMCIVALYSKSFVYNMAHINSKGVSVDKSGSKRFIKNEYNLIHEMMEKDPTHGNVLCVSQPCDKATSLWHVCVDLKQMQPNFDKIGMSAE